MAKAAEKNLLDEQPSANSTVALPSSLLHQKRLLFNRELSWLEFNRRVLEEALDTTQPLLERLKFLSIFSSNLDEFFMIRVSGLKEQLEDETPDLSPDGLTPAEQLREISARLKPMVAEQMNCLREDVLPKLKAEGIRITPYKELAKDERQALDEFFMENVFPVLTPQAVDSSHPFPYISNRSLNLGLMIEPADDPGDKFPPAMVNEARFVRLKIPPVVPRLVPVGDSGTEFTFLGELIAANADTLFPGRRAGKAYLFRVTRDADIEIREDEANDLLRVIQEQLRRRRFGAAVRLEVTPSMPAEMRRYLADALELTEEDVYVIDGPMDIPDLMTLYQFDRPELKDRPLPTLVPAPIKNGKSIFEAIRQQDILLHHPYTSYTTVTDFINAAARDPDVLAIKMCLYRAGQRSPIVQALMEASAQGKQVAVIVELKARFDEENNIEWARRLEREGVHVVYGLLGLKTHCKLALVVRREKGRLRRYVHIATGNYNPTTSRIYTDFGLFTANKKFGADATELFNFLTGCSLQSKYRRLLVAPVNLRERMIELINREAAHQKKGRRAHIIAKINSLTDIDIIRALYEASQAGVQIDLIVRGTCMLRPGVESLSETITVRSIVGRFLEHSRAFYFANGDEEELYIGSADWMSRNLDRRVEVVAPIDDPQLKRTLKEKILDIYLRDNVKARQLQPDGSYIKSPPTQGEALLSSQGYFQSRPLA
ncbi:MAG: polyphosphate kinase 1 [Pyrinomonadaceae bacterium]|nr:polyphosphate kinase 1 [Acidobacteriota bacterium]